MTSTCNIVYNLDGKDYEVEITYKKIRNIHFRFDNGTFKISCPKRASISMIKSGLDKYAKKLVARNTKTNAFGNGYVYLFGNKTPVSYPGVINFKDGSFIKFDTPEELLKKIKKTFLSFMSARTEWYEKKMNCPHYLVKVRQMKSRYGSNNKKAKTITYSMTLLHYSLDIIDSVIIHELAHCHVYDHSDRFYTIVYKYCPRYDELRKKLIKAEFE